MQCSAGSGMCNLYFTHNLCQTILPNQKLHQSLWRFQNLYMMLQAKGLYNVSHSSHLNLMHKTIYQASQATIQRKRTLYNPTLLVVNEQAPALKPKLRYHEIFKGHFLYNIKLYVNYQTHDCSINGLDHTTIQAYNCQMQSLAQHLLCHLG